MPTIKITYNEKEDYEQDFISYIGECIRRYDIDPESVPQLMDRVWKDELHMNP